MASIEEVYEPVRKLDIDEVIENISLSKYLTQEVKSKTIAAIKYIESFKLTKEKK